MTVPIPSLLATSAPGGTMTLARIRTRRRRIRRGVTIAVLVALMVWITPGSAEAGQVRISDPGRPCAMTGN
jgi:hypothetical protein